MHALCCLLWNREESAHRMQAKGAIFWRDSADGCLVTDFDLKQLHQTAFRGDNRKSRLLRDLAMSRGFRGYGAAAIEVYFFEMRDLWGASLEALRLLSTSLDQDTPAATRKFPKRRRRVSTRKETRLTPQQTEALYLVGEHKGNIAAAARAAGISRTAMAKRYRKALVKAPEAKMGKIKTRGLPHDKRGQVDVADERVDEPDKS
jgi:predicted DNA-binding protein (UPF0251 family)